MFLASRASCSLAISGIAGGPGGHSPPVLQGVRAAQPPGIAGGVGGAARKVEDPGLFGNSAPMHEKPSVF